MKSIGDLKNHNGSFSWLNDIHLLRGTFITPEYLNNGSLNYINRIMVEEKVCRMLLVYEFPASLQILCPFTKGHFAL